MYYPVLTMSLPVVVGTPEGIPLQLTGYSLISPLSGPSGTGLLFFNRPGSHGQLEEPLAAQEPSKKPEITGYSPRGYALFNGGINPFDFCTKLGRHK